MICYETIGDHVLMPCGHGGNCHACAQKLMTQHPRMRHCPICRAKITSVCKVALDTSIGTTGNVLESFSTCTPHALRAGEQASTAVSTGGPAGAYMGPATLFNTWRAWDAAPGAGPMHGSNVYAPPPEWLQAREAHASAAYGEGQQSVPLAPGEQRVDAPLEGVTMGGLRPPWVQPLFFQSETHALDNGVDESRTFVPHDVDEEPGVSGGVARGVWGLPRHSMDTQQPHQNANAYSPRVVLGVPTYRPTQGPSIVSLNPSGDNRSVPEGLIASEIADGRAVHAGGALRSVFDSASEGGTVVGNSQNDGMRMHAFSSEDSRLQHLRDAQGFQLRPGEQTVVSFDTAPSNVVSPFYAPRFANPFEAPAVVNNSDTHRIVSPFDVPGVVNVFTSPDTWVLPPGAVSAVSFGASLSVESPFASPMRPWVLNCEHIQWSMSPENDADEAENV